MEINSEQLEDTRPSQEFDGSWERAHRNIAAAACIGLLISGIIYVYAQGFLIAVFGLFNGLGELRAGGDENFLERLSQNMTIMKSPMRFSIFISQFLFMLLPILWIIKRWHTTRIFSYVRVSRVSFIELSVAVAAAVCFVPVNGGMSYFLRKQLNVPDFLSQINAQIFTSYSAEELMWLVVVVCITPALCEEVLFRGYFQRTLERTLGMKSLFIAGTIFGLYHMQPLNLISLSLLGCMFGYFFYRSKCLFPGIAAHFVNNLLAVFSLYKTPDGNIVFEIFEYEIPFLGYAAALLLTGGLLFLYHQITKKNF